MTPIALKGRVPADWIGTGRRMSEPSFALAFAGANDAALEALGLSRAYREATGFTLEVAEAKYVRRSPLGAGETFRILSWPAGVDDRRLSLVHRMIRADGRVAAEAEIVFLNVGPGSLDGVPFSRETRARLAELAALAHLRSPTT